jgi:oligopeptide/dipeptide ABC transporter ATP-binding protein
MSSHSAAAAPVLRTERLSKSFHVPQPWPRASRPLFAVNEVSLTLPAGRTLGIVGESGCGKSTLSRLLAGTLQPSSGSIELEGVDLTTLKGAERTRRLRDVQMVFQSPYTSLDPRMRVGQAVREPLDVHERSVPVTERNARAAAMLKRVGLDPATYFARFPHELSGGQRQRVGIARALVYRTRVVVCDEPVSALDVSVQAQVVNLLRELQAELQVAYVFVSHDLAVVGAISHEIAVMYLGRVVELGTAREVLGTPRHPYTQVLVESTNIPEPVVEKARTPRLLSGEVPSPIDPPSGCPFRTRCWMATELCSTTIPKLQLRPGITQLVACHHV